MSEGSKVVAWHSRDLGWFFELNGRRVGPYSNKDLDDSKFTQRAARARNNVNYLDRFDRRLRLNLDGQGDGSPLFS
jgi:hypothetical protein